MLQQIDIRVLAREEVDRFSELVQLFEDVFEMKNFTAPPTHHLQQVLHTNGFFAFVALIDDKVIGGLTVYTLTQYYSIKPLGYIYDLAVARARQRKGIGKELIAYTCKYLQSLGYEEVFVQADKADGYALDFYRKTRPTEEEDVSHFYYTL